MATQGSSLQGDRCLPTLRPVKAGQNLELAVQSLTLEGEGVGELEQRQVHCRRAFPGELVQVRIEAVSRHHPRAHATLRSVVRGHVGRRRAPCLDHESRLGRCSGCALMELDESAQREAKLVMLRDRFGLQVETLEAAPVQLGYRHSSKRVVLRDARSGGPYLGSFAQGSHRPASMANCLVDHPALMRAFTAVESQIRALAIEPYDELLHTGDLRYVWAKTNGEQVIVTLVTAGETTRVGELASKLPVDGVLHSVQAGHGNALRGTPATLLQGVAEVTVALLEQSVEVGALGFVQPNPAVAGEAYRMLTDHPGGALAFDLYAGAGVTTRVLRTRFAEVRACEAQPESAAALGVEPSTVEVFLAGTTRTPELVIANPPRKGLGPEVCAALLRLQAPALHIMSCGPEGLARDLTSLAPGYTVRALRAFDTLPQTPHVELVAQLVRA
jgi:23S rRNA (uracil1939-C5)-methyltransferase